MNNATQFITSINFEDYIMEMINGGFFENAWESVPPNYALVPLPTLDAVSEYFRTYGIDWDDRSMIGEIISDNHNDFFTEDQLKTLDEILGGEEGEDKNEVYSAFEEAFARLMGVDRFEILEVNDEYMRRRDEAIARAERNAVRGDEGYESEN
jgi:hypothetical protein